MAFFNDFISLIGRIYYYDNVDDDNDNNNNNNNKQLVQIGSNTSERLT